MRPFSRVKLGVALQIMKTSKASLARRTLVRLLLAVCQKMTFQVMVSCEVGRAIRTLVALCRGRFWAVLVARQAHLARRRAGIVIRQRAREREGTIAWILVWAGCNVLMMLLRREWLLVLLSNAFHIDPRGGALHGRRVRGVV
jgi:hypothetical protein